MATASHKAPEKPTGMVTLTLTSDEARYVYDALTATCPKQHGLDLGCNGDEDPVWEALDKLDGVAF